MKKNLENIPIKDSNLLRIAKGTIIAFILTLIFLFLFSILLTYSDIGENVIPTVLIVITGISILIGSSISSLKIKKNGIVYGGLVGLIYILLLYFVSSTVSNDFSLSLYSIIMIIAAICSGMVGGIVGVNVNNL